MADAKTRLYSLPEITEINSDMYLMLDASATGVRKYNLKTMYDKVDGVQASADAANTAATAAAAAVDSANQAAQQAASAAESATTTVQGLVEDVDEALEAIEDISEQAVPLMSENVRGGAKLGTGLEVTDGTLSVNTTASGDGSQAGPILSLSAKGWAEQDSTTGKNLLPNNVKTATSNGITWTAVSNGSVTANGTASGGTSSFVLGGEGSGIYQRGSTYTLSCDTNAVNLGFWSQTSGSMNAIGSLTFTVPDSGDWNFNANVTSGTTVSNLTFYPQLELGSTATEYEPYTGAAPSPSPDYPQEIQVAKGRNLLPPNFENGNIDANGQNSGTSSSYVRTVGMIKVEPNTRYSVTIQHLMEHAVLQAYVLEYTSGGTYVAGSRRGIHVQNTATADTARVTFLTSSTTGNVRLFIFSSDAIDASVFDGFQFELGSTPTPYVPYGYVGMEARRNMLWEQGAINGADGVRYDESKASNATRIRFAELEHLKVGESYSAYISTGYEYCLQFYNESGIHDNTKYPSIADIWTSEARTFTAKVPYVAIAIRKTSQANIAPSEHEALVFGTTTPIPLPSRGWAASLPDGTADVLTLDGAGKVTWERKTEEITYDGSESWGGYGTQDGNKYAFRVSPSDAISRKSYGIDVLCTHYPKASRNFTDNNRILFNSTTMSVKADYVTFIDNVNATSDNWTAFLAQNPVTVLYPLATPVTEERGYVEMPEIPVGADISCPELDDLGVKYCVDDAASELARMWYGKAKSEYAEELMELRVTVNELATRIN